MVISARTANNSSSPANPLGSAPAAGAPEVPVVDLRVDPTVRSGAYAFDNEDFSVRWHRHPMHQISYAFEGAVEVEVPRARFLLPPQQAVVVPAGLVHRIRFRQVRTVSVFLADELLDDIGTGAAILAVSPMLREMIVHGSRWPIDRPPGDALADDYFSVLARLVCEAIEHEPPFALPTAQDPVIAAVMERTTDDLRSATAETVCAAVGISARSMRRRFRTETGMTWRAYVQRSRLLHAVALLSEPDAHVLTTATEVGFESASAFARAFRELVGESPSAYRRRVLAAASGARSAGIVTGAGGADVAGSALLGDAPDGARRRG